MRQLKLSKKVLCTRFVDLRPFSNAPLNSFSFNAILGDTNTIRTVSIFYKLEDIDSISKTAGYLYKRCSENNGNSGR